MHRSETSTTATKTGRQDKQKQIEGNCKRATKMSSKEGWCTRGQWPKVILDAISLSQNDKQAYVVRDPDETTNSIPASQSHNKFTTVEKQDQHVVGQTPSP